MKGELRGQELFKVHSSKSKVSEQKQGIYSAAGESRSNAFGECWVSRRGSNDEQSMKTLSLQIEMK